MPRRAARKIFQSIVAPHKMTSVQAGATDPVHEETMKNLYRQKLVQVEGQSDILMLGVPYIGPYNVDSTMNPILVHNMVLGYLFNLYKGKPLVRRGGVVIATHPVPYEFDEVHHPSYKPFFDEVLAETTDPHEAEQRFEQKYIHDPWYKTLYRNSHAYHGWHPFTTWQWGAHALDHLGDRNLRRRRPDDHEAYGLQTRRHRRRSPGDRQRHCRPEPEQHLHAHPATLYVRGVLAPTDFLVARG